MLDLLISQTWEDMAVRHDCDFYASLPGVWFVGAKEHGAYMVDVANEDVNRRGFLSKVDVAQAILILAEMDEIKGEAGPGCIILGSVNAAALPDLGQEIADLTGLPVQNLHLSRDHLSNMRPIIREVAKGL